MQRVILLNTSAEHAGVDAQHHPYSGSVTRSGHRTPFPAMSDFLGNTIYADNPLADLYLDRIY